MYRPQKPEVRSTITESKCSLRSSFITTKGTLNNQVVRQISADKTNGFTCRLTIVWGA